MAGKTLPLRDGERIPRRPPPTFEEFEGEPAAGILAQGWRIWKVALDDSNQYGPHAMVVLLILMASITGIVLRLMWYMFA